MITQFKGRDSITAWHPAAEKTSQIIAVQRMDIPTQEPEKKPDPIRRGVSDCPIMTTPAMEPGFLVRPVSDHKFNQFKYQQQTEEYYSKRDFLRERKILGEAQPERAAANRLVNTRKSPTRGIGVNDRVTVARFYARGWSGEQRVSIESFTRLQEAPAPRVGDRHTEALSKRGARAIMDSGSYVSAVRGGYTTFLTLTFDSEARARILNIQAIPGEPAEKGDFCAGFKAAGPFSRVEFDTESTIGREVSRFFDGVQKMYQRGWVAEAAADDLLSHESEQIEGSPEPLDYMWVAEQPKNDDGEENPHCHVLMRWQVEPQHFKSWAKRIEKIWGQGFAHLERIRKPEAAGKYILKALGYFTKGAASIDEETGEVFCSQGRIRGNRYNISRSARAPDWECLAEFEAERMGQVLAEVGQQVKQRQDELSQELSRARAAEKHDKAQIAKFNRYKLPYAIKKRHIERLQRRLKTAELEIKQIQAQQQSEAWGNRYKVTFRNTEQVQEFLSHAITARGWTAKALEWSQQSLKRAGQLKDWTVSTGRKIAAAVERETMNRLKDMQNLLWWAEYIRPAPPAKPEPFNGWEPVYCWESGL